MWERFHRWLAISLAVPLVVWSVTGLMFHLKPGWDRAYEQLTPERTTGPDLGAVVPVSTISETLAGSSSSRPISKVELFETVLGPLYRVRADDRTTLVDARTGRVLSPLTVDQAKALAMDAVARSPHRAAYGDPHDTTVAAETIDVRFDDEITVEVGRSDATLTQHGSDTSRIDWLYRIHYLQWTGNRTLDRVIAMAGLVLIWAALIPGVVLFTRRLRRRRSS
jgi:uncharacterized iron-regulated membrane protein